MVCCHKAAHVRVFLYNSVASFYDVMEVCYSDILDNVSAWHNNDDVSA